MDKLVEHRKENYPEGMYDQPHDAFWHDASWVYCSLCYYDKEKRGPVPSSR